MLVVADAERAVSLAGVMGDRRPRSARPPSTYCSRGLVGSGDDLIAPRERWRSRATPRTASSGAPIRRPVLPPSALRAAACRGGGRQRRPRRARRIPGETGRRDRALPPGAGLGAARVRVSARRGARGAREPRVQGRGRRSDPAGRDPPTAAT
jgi:hypothetical protein